MMHTWFHIIRRDMRLSWRRKGSIFQSLLFCLILLVLFPFAVGNEPGLLEKIGGGILWVALILVSALNLPHLFEEDFEDGSLEASLQLPVHFTILTGGKILAHWLASGVAIALFSPLFALLFNLPAALWPDLVCSLLVGSLLLTLIGAFAGALSLGLKKAGLLVSLLVLPLNIPVLIFGVTVLGEARLQGYIGLLALLLILLPVTLVAATLALKAAVSEA
jgi:heme exporter protein B